MMVDHDPGAFQMLCDGVTLCIHYGGEFVEDFDYVGGKIHEYHDYNIEWAYDDVDEIMGLLGYVKIVKVGVQTCGSKVFNFLNKDKNEWVRYLGLAVDKDKKCTLYIEAMTENEKRYEERHCLTNNNSLDEHHDCVIESLEDDGEEDAILEGEEALVGSDGTNDDSEGERGDEITIGGEESDSPLDDCDFSDEEDEILEARNNLRLRRLAMITDLGCLNVENVGDQIVRCIQYSKNCDHTKLEFDVGMRFKDVAECKEAVILWSILNGYNIKWTKSSKERVQAECVDNCNWRLYAGKVTADQPTFVIKTYEKKHDCVFAKSNRQAHSGWLATQMIDILKVNPNMTAKEMKNYIKLKFGVTVTIAMCYRTKDHALKKIRGSYIDDYKKLRSYVSELMRTDKEGRFELKTSLNKKGECIFERIYIGFSALKKGFMIGCRRIIGFDGCHLKTVLGGVLLAAVGRDCNRKMYPIAWAVVEKENQATWTWFCKILFEELGIIDGLGWSFMTDKQKGLINAIQHLTPNAEHRHCARHVYGNWKKKHVGEKFMALFWECVKACTTAQFQRKLEELRIESQKAHDDFCARNPKSFCKSLLCSNTKSDATDNNISEAFNSFILSARDKPILHMLEEIRKSVMVKIHEFSNAVKKSQDVICPAVRKRLYKIDGQARYCRITASIHDKYEVTLFGETHVVDLNARACSCRDWELIGIPCSHACACINYSRLDVVDFVDSFFFKKTWEETYAHGLEPLRGEIEWPKITENPIMPPHFTKRPGRPKKQRKRSQDEVRKSNPSKLTRHGIRMKCTNCGELGHNRRSCQKNKDINQGTASTALMVPERPSASKSKGKTTASKSSKGKTTASKSKGKTTQDSGLLVCDSGNVFWKDPGEGRVQFLATSRASTDSSFIGERTMAQQASQTPDGGSQIIDNPTPHS